MLKLLENLLGIYALTAAGCLVVMPFVFIAVYFLA